MTEQSSKLSTVKDVVGIVQNLLAIAAIIAGGVWFYLQAPFRPTVKASISSTVVKKHDHYQVGLVATFENTGHTAFHYTCSAIVLFPLPQTFPDPRCGPDDSGTLQPNESVSFGDVYRVGFDEKDLQYGRAVLGNGGPTWRGYFSSAVATVFLQDLDTHSKDPGTGRAQRKPK